MIHQSDFRPVTPAKPVAAYIGGKRLLAATIIDRIAAIQAGTTAALDHAERENEIREVIERTGAAYADAAKGVDLLRASRKGLDAERGLAGLRRDIGDAEALTRSLSTGNPAAFRRTQVDAQTRRFANDNRLSENDNRVAEFRSLKERDYADQLRRSAVETNRARDATTRYREEMASLNEQRATGVLTEEAYKEEWKRIERERLGASKDFADGAKRALWDYAEEAGNAAKRAERLFTNAFRSMEDALVNFVKTGKLDFASLADSIISDLIRMQIQASITGPLSQALSAGLGSMFNGLFGGGGGSAPMGDFGTSGGGTMLAHTGGVIGHDSLVRRHVDHALFNGAARYHVGGIVGLRPGEVPIIANRNEEVVTEDNPRHIRNAARQPVPAALRMPPSPVAVNIPMAVNIEVINQTPTPVKGEAREGQRGGGGGLGGIDQRSIRLMLTPVVGEIIRSGDVDPDLRSRGTRTPVRRAS